MMKSDEDRKTQVRHAIRKVAKDAGLELEFLPARRSSDLTFVVARGDRQGVQVLPIQVFEELSPGVDVELISFKQTESGQYRVTFVVTEVLASQQVLMEERRAKLRLVQRDLLGDA
jgi:hypothetical protein